MPPEKFDAKQSKPLDKTPSVSEHQNHTGASDVMRWKSKSAASDQDKPGMPSETALRKIFIGSPEVIKNNRGKNSENSLYYRAFAGDNSVIDEHYDHLFSIRDNLFKPEEFVHQNDLEKTDKLTKEWHARNYKKGTE